MFSFRRNVPLQSLFLSVLLFHQTGAGGTRQNTRPHYWYITEFNYSVTISQFWIHHHFIRDWNKWITYFCVCSGNLACNFQGCLYRTSREHSLAFHKRVHNGKYMLKYTEYSLFTVFYLRNLCTHSHMITYLVLFITGIWFLFLTMVFCCWCSTFNKKGSTMLNQMFDRCLFVWDRSFTVSLL